MNLHFFNAALAFGWVLLVTGLALWSISVALVVGGAVVIGLTLLLAFRVGVANQSDAPKGKV